MKLEVRTDIDLKSSSKNKQQQDQGIHQAQIMHQLKARSTNRRERERQRTSEIGARALERRRGSLLRHSRRLRVHGRGRGDRMGRVDRLRGRHPRGGGRHHGLLLLLARLGVPPVVLRRHGEQLVTRRG
jgi:hypothetical protein